MLYIPLLNLCTMKYLATNGEALCMTHFQEEKNDKIQKKQYISFKNLFQTFFVKKNICRIINNLD